MPGNPSTPVDEADVALSAFVSNVRRTSDGLDYAGTLLLAWDLRITDSNNGPDAIEPATGEATVLSLPFDCVPTSDESVGSTCRLDTTLDVLVPGLIKEGMRTIIDTARTRVLDTGSDGSVTPPVGSCPPSCGSGDEHVFLRQGTFAP